MFAQTPHGTFTKIVWDLNILNSAFGSVGSALLGFFAIILFLSDSLLCLIFLGSGSLLTSQFDLAILFLALGLLCGGFFGCLGRVFGFKCLFGLVGFVLLLVAFLVGLSLLEVGSLGSGIQLVPLFGHNLQSK